MLIKEFLDFLKEYNVVSLALAVIMGTAGSSLVNSLVKDIIMPLFTPLFSTEKWQDAVWNIGSIHLAYGSFIAELINFIILGLVVFFIAKKLFAEKKVTKK